MMLGMNDMCDENDRLKERIAELERQVSDLSDAAGQYEDVLSVICAGDGAFCSHEEAMKELRRLAEADKESFYSDASARDWKETATAAQAELAAAQATISRKDEALERIGNTACGEASHQFIALEALALPADRTALDAMLAEARKEGVQWRPIETAPRDGTAIVLCWAINADGEAINWLESPNTAGVFVQVASWWKGDGWVVYCNMVKDPSLHFEPTHWMPLMPPPAIRQEAERSE